MESQLEFSYVIAAIKRRKRLFLTTFLLILLTSLIVAIILPSVYKAETTILRESQQVSEDYIRSTITGYAEERINLVTQQIKGRGTLLQLIEMFDLYPNRKKNKAIEEIISEMRSAIQLQTIYENVTDERTGRGINISTAFLLSYEGRDPVKVQKVVNTLASLYIERESREREERSSGTSSFLQEELGKLKNAIRGYEERMRLYKEQHVGEMPENYSMNLRQLEQLERELERIETQIQNLKERKLFIEGQMVTIDPLLPIQTDQGKMVVNPGERLKRLRLELMSYQSVLSDKHPDIKKLKNEIRELEKQLGQSDEATMKIKRLKELEEELASLKGRLGPKHPDIIQKEKETEALSAEVDQLLTERIKSEVSEERPDNPTYINLKTQIYVIESEMKSLYEGVEELENSIAKYKRRIESAPLIEKEYIELTRDYEGLKQKYNDISNKLLEADVSQGMEISQRGEKFVVVDIAPLPEKPYKPNRIAIIAFGFILALCSGMGLVAIKEAMDHSIKSVDELNQITGLSVFTVVSYIETAEEKRKRKIKKMAWAISIIGLIAIALIAVDQFVMSMDELWIEIGKRFGIIIV